MFSIAEGIQLVTGILRYCQSA